MNGIIRNLFAAAMLAACFAAPHAAAQSIKLPSCIGDDMVLQQNTVCRIWGWTLPEEKMSVTASWLDKPVRTKSDRKGCWSVKLKTPAGSYEPQSVTIEVLGKEVTLKNLLIGEVWLCAGQSNMEWSVRRTTDLVADLKLPPNDRLRLYDTGHIFAESPQDDIRGACWKICDQTSLPTFSAVAYAFGKKLQAELDVPVGLINASYGGTNIECWMSKQTIGQSAQSGIIAKCIAANRNRWKGKESHHYNANIYPLRQLSIAGVIWYQGCTNVYIGPMGYKDELVALIEGWRGDFRNYKMPFYIVQIAPQLYPTVRGATLRESQSTAAEMLDHAEYVVTNDQTDIPGDIHPRQKKVVGERLAACALGEHYGRDVVFRSPAYARHEVRGDGIVVWFDNLPTRLEVRGPRIHGFQIGHKNGRSIEYVLAEAAIDPSGRTVTVRAEGITDPTCVRYCFDESVGTLFSAEGLPVAPFRTDREVYLPGARDYVEIPSQIAVRVDGVGFERSNFSYGASMWCNQPDRFLSRNYPPQFEGFEMAIPPSASKAERSQAAKITASDDGRIYCIASSATALRNFSRGWRMIPATRLNAETVRFDEDGNRKASPLAPIFILYREVKRGETVALPVTNDIYSVIPIARKIEFVQ